MTPRLSVRLLAEPDLPQVGEWMRLAAEAPRWNTADLQTILRPAPAGDGRVRCGWAAVDAAGQLCGVAIAAAVRAAGLVAECELEFLFTATGWRRQGVASRMLRVVLAWGEEMGAPELLLEVRRANMAAQQLYAAAGFVAAGVRRAYYSDPTEDALLMRRTLRGHGQSGPYNAR